MSRDFVATYPNPNGRGFIVSIGDPPGRWMHVKRPTQEYLRCEGAGCQYLTQRGDWYWRDKRIGVLCERCADRPGTIRTFLRDGVEIEYTIPPHP